MIFYSLSLLHSYNTSFLMYCQQLFLIIFEKSCFCKKRVQEIEQAISVFLWLVFAMCI